jgi:hypothetical protein
MPYDVIKAPDQPDTALTPENLVDLTFDLLKHPVEGVRIDYSKDSMHMIGHHHGSIQVYGLVVLILHPPDRKLTHTYAAEIADTSRPWVNQSVGVAPPSTRIVVPVMKVRWTGADRS